MSTQQRLGMVDDMRAEARRTVRSERASRHHRAPSRLVLPDLCPPGCVECAGCPCQSSDASSGAARSRARSGRARRRRGPARISPAAPASTPSQVAGWRPGAARARASSTARSSSSPRRSGTSRGRSCPTQGLGHLPQHELGQFLRHLLGELLGQIAHLGGREISAERGIQLHSLAAARHRNEIQTEGFQSGPQLEGNNGTFPKAGGFSRVEIEDDPVGIGRLPVGVHAPLRNMELQGIEIDEIGQRRQVAHQRICHVIECGMRQPARCARRQILLEERHITDAVRNAPGSPADRQKGQQIGTDLGVVVEHLTLGRLRSRDRGACRGWTAGFRPSTVTCWVCGSAIGGLPDVVGGEVGADTMKLG